MRIIAGRAKGRILAEPAGITRPTSDRAREGIFSALESVIGTCAGITFFDLYGGTGAVGLEALSRGAKHLIVVENDSNAVAVCRENYNRVSEAISGKFEIKGMSVDSFLDSGALLQADVVYLDPPYAVKNKIIASNLEKLLAMDLLSRDCILIVERATRAATLTWPADLLALKERRYGEGMVYFGKRARLATVYS